MSAAAVAQKKQAGEAEGVFKPRGRQMILRLDEILAAGNVRTVETPEKDRELESSVRERGVLVPVIVVDRVPSKSQPQKFLLKAGFRRFHAAKRVAGKDWERAQLFAVVYSASDLEALEMALIENLQREEMTAYDKAVGFQKLKDIHGLTGEQIAEKLNMSAGVVSQHLSMLLLPKGVLTELKAGNMSFTVARELTRLREDEKLVVLAWEKLEKEAAGERPSAIDAKRVVDELLSQAKEQAASGSKGAPRAISKAAPASSERSARSGDKGSDKIAGGGASKTSAASVGQALPERDSIVDAIRQLKMRPRRERGLRELLQEQFTLFEQAKADSEKQKYRYICQGVALAAGIDVGALDKQMK